MKQTINIQKHTQHFNVNKNKQFSTKQITPLWNLSLKSISIQQNNQEIQHFLASVKPIVFLQVEENVLLLKLANLIMLIEIYAMDHLYTQQQREYGWIQYLFILFFMVKFFGYCEKSYQQKEDEHQIIGHKMKQNIHKRHNKSYPGIFSKLLGFKTSQIRKFIDIIILSIGYGIYYLVQPFFYFPEWSPYAIFVLLGILWKNHPLNSKGVNISCLLIYSLKFNSYWIGLLGIIFNTNYKFYIEKDSINTIEQLNDQENQRSTLDWLILIDIIFLIILFDKQTFKWAMIIILYYCLVKIVCKMDKKCRHLKRPYKDYCDIIKLNEYH